MLPCDGTTQPKSPWSIFDITSWSKFIYNAEFGQDIGWVELTKDRIAMELHLGNKGMLSCDGTNSAKHP